MNRENYISGFSKVEVVPTSDVLICRNIENRCYCNLKAGKSWQEIFFVTGTPELGTDDEPYKLTFIAPTPSAANSSELYGYVGKDIIVRVTTSYGYYFLGSTRFPARMAVANTNAGDVGESCGYSVSITAHEDGIYNNAEGNVQSLTPSVDYSELIESLSEQISALNTKCDKLSKSLLVSPVQIGTVIWWSGTETTIPSGYLVCDGRTLLKSEYQDLFAVVGDNHGETTSTTFKIPDIIDRFIFGDISRYVGTIGGSTTFNVSIANLPPHRHVFMGNQLKGNNNVGLYEEVDTTTQDIGVSGDSNYSRARNYYTKSVGLGEPVYNVPPYIKLLPIIRAK